MPRSKPDLRLLSKISKLYYESGLTQGEIVQRMQLSTATVSRLLQQARDEGIVRISVISPPGVYSDLEVEMEKRFGLQEAVIVDVPENASSETITREVGTAAAAYLERNTHEGDHIGVSWGSTLDRMVASLQPVRSGNLHVVQMIGGLGSPGSEVHATDLCQRMAHVLNSRLTLLPAPGIVDHQAAKTALLSDSHVAQAFEAMPNLTIAYVGIGSPTSLSTVMRDSAILKPAELEDLLKKGAMGDIALRFFDSQGKAIDSNVDPRVLGISLAQLQRIPRVVGVAGGLPKTAAVLGALRGGLIHVLITDQHVARQILSGN
jgi:DNA-binding transcriptional regulator LsrR (DeoR family)